MTNESDARQRPARSRPPFECIALVLQGGGALGAYQAGVYQALDEAGLDPDWISGISIGAFNSAIIAGNPRGARVAKLREFWESITQPYVNWKTPTALQAAAAANVAASMAPQSSEFWTLASSLVPALALDTSRGLLNQWAAGRVLWSGTPGFFALRPVTPWLWPGSSVRATSYYDTTALKETLWHEGYADTMQTLSHPEVLQRASSPEGVFIFDIAEHRSDKTPAGNADGLVKTERTS